MLVSVFAAAAMMLAQGAASTESAAQSASTTTTQQTAQAKPKPEMKRVCSKLESSENSRAPQKHCWMEPVKTASNDTTQTAEAKEPD